MTDQPKWAIKGLGSVQKFLKKKRIQSTDKKKILNAIEDLENNPYPAGSKKLKGRPGRRIAVGDYRILYNDDKDERTVVILKIDKREDVYKKEAFEPDDSEML